MGSSRARKLNRRLDDLFPQRRVFILRCPDGHRTEVDGASVALALEHGCGECRGDAPLEIHRTEQRGCRVCGEPAGEYGSDRLRKYCSDRCRDIATFVHRAFTWGSVRSYVLERDLWRCWGCDADVSEDGEREPEVDHIQPISEGGHPLDERNLMTLCSRCHAEKTNGGTVASDPVTPRNLAAYLGTDG